MKCAIRILCAGTKRNDSASLQYTDAKTRACNRCKRAFLEIDSGLTAPTRLVTLLYQLISIAREIFSICFTDIIDAPAVRRMEPHRIRIQDIADRFRRRGNSRHSGRIFLAVTSRVVDDDSWLHVVGIHTEANRV